MEDGKAEKEGFINVNSGTLKMTIGGFTIDTDNEKVSIYGSTDITMDKAGRLLALNFRAFLKGLVGALRSVGGEVQPEPLSFKPFANESQSIVLAGFTIENREDRVSIYGKMDVARNKVGLTDASSLYALMDDTLRVLDSAELPEHVEIAESKIVKNPFM